MRTISTKTMVKAAHCGNQMAMTPRSLLAFGELYRRGGTTADGTRVLSEDWIAKSWTPRITSRFHDGRYGYGWFIDTFAGHEGRYGWGYGGQMIYVIPDLDLTVAITSAEDQPSARSGYVQDLHRLVSETIVPAAANRGLFLLALVFTPVATVVPSQAATPALLVVGFLILSSNIREIDWSDFTIAIPAFLTMVLMPFTYSITNGIGIGFITFCVLRLVAGRGKEVPVALYAVAAVFTFYYLMPALGLL